MAEDKTKPAAQKAAPKTTAAPKKAPAAKAAAPKAAAPKAAAKKPAAKKAAAPKKSAAWNPGNEERYNLIQVAAYYLAERDGFSGNPVDYWSAAEIQISGSLPAKK